MKSPLMDFEALPRAVAIAFGHAGNRARAVSVISICTSLCVAGLTAYEFSEVSGNLANAQSDLARVLATPATAAAPRTDALTIQQRQFLGRAARRLNTDWSSLLDSLEATLPDEVSLVSIEPDGASGKVRIQAEARSLDVLIAYASALRAIPTFSAVSLVKHETIEQDTNRPVRLTLEVAMASRFQGKDAK